MIGRKQIRHSARIALTAFDLRDVCQEFGGIRVLDQINLEIPAREFTALVGPSGSGKTSLLRLLNRLDDPTRGSIRYLDRRVNELPIDEHRTRVGFVFQVPTMFPGTVRDNLAVPGEIAKIAGNEADHRMKESLQLAEVDFQFLDRDAARLSVGQKQRVSIARALMTKPETLLLDEPTASLDPETADKLMSTIARFTCETGVTVVAATHRLAEARKISNRLIMLEHGKVVDEGTTAEVFEGPGHARIRTFFTNAS